MNKQIKVKVLLNRVIYNPTADLSAIASYFAPRLIDMSFDVQKVDITGYTTVKQLNPMGNYQYVLNDIDGPVTQFLDETHDICVLVINGIKEFGVKCPSECAEKQYVAGTKTVLMSVNADDPFSNTQPNFYMWLLHGLKHTLGTMSGYDGFPVDDCMDRLINCNGQMLYYFRNYEPEDVNSNHIIMMELLNPWLISQKKSI